jgi:hypothetical protein
VTWGLVLRKALCSSGPGRAWHPAISWARRIPVLVGDVTPLQGWPGNHGTPRAFALGGYLMPLRGYPFWLPRSSVGASPDALASRGRHCRSDCIKG